MDTEYLSRHTGAEIDAAVEAIPNKQDKIQDLQTIRAGAALGATALQPESPELDLMGENENSVATKGYVDGHSSDCCMQFFEDFISGAHLETQMQSYPVNKKVYCTQGTSGSGNTSVSIKWTQNATRTIYVKTLIIKYKNDPSDTEENTYKYSFTAKVFSREDEKVYLNNLEWIDYAEYTGTTSLTTGYTSANAHAFGATSGCKLTELRLATDSLAGKYITGVSVETRGSASTNASLSVFVGEDQWLYNDSTALTITTTHTLYDWTAPDGEGTQLDEAGGEIYEETFIVRTEEDTLERITPLDEVLYACKADEKLYRFNETLVETSRAMELGFVSGTAYPGDEGQSNRDDITTLKADRPRTALITILLADWDESQSFSYTLPGGRTVGTNDILMITPSEACSEDYYNSKISKTISEEGTTITFTYQNIPEDTITLQLALIRALGM